MVVALSSSRERERSEGDRRSNYQLRGVIPIGIYRHWGMAQYPYYLQQIYSNRYYFTDNPAAHHLSPTASTGGAKVSVKHDDTSASLADGGVSNTVHAVVTTLATL